MFIGILDPWAYRTISCRLSGQGWDLLELSTQVLSLISPDFCFGRPATILGHLLLSYEGLEPCRMSTGLAGGAIENLG